MIKQVVAHELIDEVQIWIEMLEPPHRRALTPDESPAKRAIALVVEEFWPVLRHLREQPGRRLEKKRLEQEEREWTGSSLLQDPDRGVRAGRWSLPGAPIRPDGLSGSTEAEIRAWLVGVPRCVG